MMKAITLLLISASAIGLFVTGCMHLPPDDTPKERNLYSTRLSGLRWLKSIQNKDGSWGEDSNSQPALTSLAILAFLHSNHTPTSDEFGGCVENGMRKLLSYSESGLPASRIENEYISTDSIFAWALAESYSLTRIPDFAHATRNALQRILDSETRVSPWTMQSLKSAYLSGATRVSSKRQYLEAMQNVITRPVDGDMLSAARSINDRLLAGGSVAEREASDKLTQMLAQSVATSWKDHQQDYPMLMRFLCAWAFFYRGGEIWENWYSDGFDEILKHQRRKGRLGWWEIPVTDKGMGQKEKDLWQGNDSSIYATAMMILSHPPDRCLPTFTPDILQVPKADQEPAEDDIRIEIQI